VKLANIIFEQEELKVDEPFMDDFGAQIAKAVESELEQHKDELDQVDEAIGALSVVGYVLLSNTVASMLAKMSKYLAKKFNSPKMVKSAEWWEEFTHKNEEAFMTPIKRVVSLFVKDPAKQKAITKVLYSIVIFSMAGQAGQEAVGYLKKTEWAAAAGYSAKALIKGKEVSDLIQHAVADLVK
jgi:hypothetical protein